MQHYGSEVEDDVWIIGIWLKFLKKVMMESLGGDILKKLESVTPSITSVDGLLSRNSNILANDLGISPKEIDRWKSLISSKVFDFNGQKSCLCRVRSHPKCSFGIPRLDEVMMGGIPKGNMVEVIGDNLCKLSLIGASLAITSSSSGKPVYLFSSGQGTQLEKYISIALSSSIGPLTQRLDDNQQLILSRIQIIRIYSPWEILDHLSIIPPSLESADSPIVIIDNLHDLISPFLLPEPLSSSNNPLPSFHLESLISRVLIHLRRLLYHQYVSAVLLLNTFPSTVSSVSARDIISTLAKSLPFWGMISDSVDMSLYSLRTHPSIPPSNTDLTDWIYEENTLFETDLNTPNIFALPSDSSTPSLDFIPLKGL